MKRQKIWRNIKGKMKDKIKSETARREQMRMKRIIFASKRSNIVKQKYVLL